MKKGEIGGHCRKGSQLNLIQSVTVEELDRTVQVQEVAIAAMVGTLVHGGIIRDKEARVLYALIGREVTRTSKPMHVQRPRGEGLKLSIQECGFKESINFVIDFSEVWSFIMAVG